MIPCCSRFRTQPNLENYGKFILYVLEDNELMVLSKKIMVEPLIRYWPWDMKKQLRSIQDPDVKFFWKMYLEPKPKKKYTTSQFYLISKVVMYILELMNRVPSDILDKWDDFFRKTPYGIKIFVMLVDYIYTFKRRHVWFWPFMLLGMARQKTVNIV